MSKRVIVSPVVVMVAGLGMRWDVHSPVVLGEAPAKGPGLLRAVRWPRVRLPRWPGLLGGGGATPPRQV